LFTTSGFVDGSVYPYEYILSDYLQQNANDLVFSWDHKQYNFKRNEHRNSEIFNAVRKLVKWATNSSRIEFLESVIGPEWKNLKRNNLFLDPNELADLSRHDLFSIGIHGRKHLTLSSCNTWDKREELQGAQEDFRIYGVDTIPAYSYPYGDFDNVSFSELSFHGYKLGFGTFSNRLKDYSLFSIPRMKI